MFRHASSDRSIGAILEFTRETTGAVPNAGRSERYADDLTRRNDWLRQIQQGGIRIDDVYGGEATNRACLTIEEGVVMVLVIIIIIIIIKVVIVVADGLLRVTTITEVTARSTRRGRIIFVSNSNNRISKECRCRRDSRRRITIDGTAASPSQQYRSYYGDQEFSRAEEEQYFGQPALDPKDDAAFENQFQSRRNYNYGDDFLDNGGGLGGTKLLLRQPCVSIQQQSSHHGCLFASIERLG